MKTWFKELYPDGVGPYNIPSDDASSGVSEAILSISSAFCVDDELNSFFNSLQLLKQVPSSYLLPDEAFLPPESLRVFYLDPNWLSSLLDGALSIGRNCSKDAHHDRQIFPVLSDTSYRDSLYARTGGKDQSELAADNVRSGFLLRSRLISGWPGLEVKCLSEGAEAAILRLDMIGDSILFCIANGRIDSIVFTEPEESLHFCADRQKGKLYKQLVSLNERSIGATPVTVDMPFHDESLAVVDIAGLACSMQERLKQKGCARDYFSSLEFAVQMLKKRSVITIKLFWR